MYHIVEGLARLLAPILPVTADELWRGLPGTREDSVHLADFPGRDLDGFADATLIDRWQRLIAIREQRERALESKRQEKLIGTPLEANVTLTRARRDARALLQRYAADLPMLFIVSQVTVAGRGRPMRVARSRSTRAPTAPSASAAGATSPTSRPTTAFAGICGRCVDAVARASGSSIDERRVSAACGAVEFWLRDRPDRRRIRLTQVRRARAALRLHDSVDDRPGPPRTSHTC